MPDPATGARPVPATPPLRLRIARWVSIAGHPFPLVLLLAGVASLRRAGLAAALAAVAGIGLAIVAPLAFHVARGVRAGRYGDPDVSVRGERRRLYVLALGLSLAVVAVLAWLKPAGGLAAGALGAALLLAVASLVNLWWVKISLHTAFACFAAVGMAPMVPMLGAVIGGLALLVGWSRIVLGRHTWPEVAAGAVLGVAIGAALVAGWLPG